jgi:hypothetical protein
MPQYKTLAAIFIGLYCTARKKKTKLDWERMLIARVRLKPIHRQQVVLQSCTDYMESEIEAGRWAK